MESALFVVTGGVISAVVCWW